MSINPTDIPDPAYIVAGTAVLSATAGYLLRRKTPRPGQHDPGDSPAGKLPVRLRRDRTARRSVVADVQQQTAQAAELAQIPGQHRLASPQTNPAVRQHADQLRDEQQRRLLDAEHRRTLRRYRVEDQRAADAEQALQILQQAKDAKNPARSVLALHRGRRAYMGLALGASVVLAGGAAMGVGEFAAELGAPRRIGYLAELGGTGLATVVISYRAHLAQHGGTVTGWRDRVLWALILGPLAASIAANLAGAGLVGVLCSIGAAAFALLGYVIGEASAKALADQADRVTGTDEAALRAIALGEDLFAPPAAESAPEPERPALPTGHDLSDEQLVELGYDAARVQRWLADRGVDVEQREVSRLLADAPRPPVTTARLAPVAPPVVLRDGRPATTPERPAAATASNHPNDQTGDRSPDDQPPGPAKPNDRPAERPATTRPATRSTSRATGQAKTGHGDPRSLKSDRPTPEENAKAVDRYRQSVKAGRPLSQRDLAKEFGRSPGWARDRIHEAGLRPVGGTDQPGDHPERPADDRAPVTTRATG